MPDYTADEIVDIFLILGECQRNYRAAARLYITRFGYSWGQSHRGSNHPLYPTVLLEKSTPGHLLL